VTRRVVIRLRRCHFRRSVGEGLGEEEESKKKKKKKKKKADLVDENGSAAPRRGIRLCRTPKGNVVLVEKYGSAAPREENQRKKRKETSSSSSRNTALLGRETTERKETRTHKIRFSVPWLAKNAKILE
jgi:hypothetical protein